MINQTEFQKTMQERILDCFPAGSYALSALLRLVDVVETTDVETAAVECRSNPRMLVNPEFVERFAPTPEKLLMLVMHELHHVLLGHTRLFPCVTAVDNLVFDAVINALPCRSVRPCFSRRCARSSNAGRSRRTRSPGARCRIF